MDVQCGNIQAMTEDPDLIERIGRSVKGQKCYPENVELEFKRSRPFDNTEVSVVDCGTFEAVKLLEGRCCALNFAAFKAPCADYYYGNSQEEQLVRSSTLLECLIRPEMMEEFYEPHRKVSGPWFNSDAIYTPDVTVIRSLTEDCRLLRKEERYDSDVITCAAPDLSYTEYDGEKLLELQRERISRICDLAWMHGAENLILGAFGCGVFMNDPHIVAEAAATALEYHTGCFRKVVFSIPRGRNPINHDTFVKVIGDRFRTDTSPSI